MTLDLFAAPGGNGGGAAVAPFSNGEFTLTITQHDTDGFHVLAPGLARALGFRDAFRLMESIPEAEKGYTTASTPGGDQRVGYLTEAGFYRALGQRQTARITDPQIRATVERFQAWVYGDVLPRLRRGELVSAAPPLPDITTPSGVLAMAEQFAETARRLVAAERERDEFAPAAKSWETLASAEGDYSVADAAKMLTRDGNIKIGRDRLFARLREMGWVYRDRGDGRHRAYQTAVDRGLLVEMPKSHEHPDTGERVVDPPQIRVTVKGLGVLRERLAGGGALESA